MTSHSNPLSVRVAKAIAMAGAVLICQGSYCGEKPELPGLPGAVLTDIHLVIKDPSQSLPGVYLAWSYPENAKVTSFEIYGSLNADSLKYKIASPLAGDSMHFTLDLRDTVRPYTFYYGVRAVWVEPTGQRRVSDSMPIDSIRITPSLNILQPASGSIKPGRALDMEVQTGSDPGVTIMFSYYEKQNGSWSMKQSGCLPLEPCPTIIFGSSVQRETLTLEQHAAGDTVEALFCVVGTESFQELTTGLIQSLGCSHFRRVGP